MQLGEITFMTLEANILRTLQDVNMEIEMHEPLRIVNKFRKITFDLGGHLLPEITSENLSTFTDEN